MKAYVNRTRFLQTLVMESGESVFLGKGKTFRSSAPVASLPDGVEVVELENQSKPEPEMATVELPVTEMEQEVEVVEEEPKPKTRRRRSRKQTQSTD